MPYGETWFAEGARQGCRAGADDLTGCQVSGVGSFAPKYNSQELDKESDSLLL